MRFKNFLVFGLAITTLQSGHSLASSSADQGRLALIEETRAYVDNALHNFDTADMNIEVQQPDSRIEIPVCPEPFALSATPESLRQSTITVRATCEHTNWYLYLMVKVTQMQPVVVFKDVVSPGTLLSAENVSVVQLDKKAIRSSTFSAIDQVIGARAKRRNRPGQPVIPNQLCFVCKGDSIVIKANISGLEIKTSGIAQQDGNLGDTIAVKNASSKKTVYARVSNPRQVNVGI